MSVEDIQRAVCEYFGVRMADLKGKKRTRSVSHPRMIAMYLCRERLGTSYPDLGSRFGGKDHSTVINACKRMSSIQEEDPELRAIISQLRAQLVGAPLGSR